MERRVTLLLAFLLCIAAQFHPEFHFETTESLRFHQDLFIYTDEVKDALKNNKPIVALESTVISHGMPFPQNVETAKALEALVRSEGAVPATIALLDGTVRIGLDNAALGRLGQGAAQKVSRRDIAAVLAQGGMGATTVAATMLLASMAGLRVFATGGIGGVHRGDSGDISADLRELGRTPLTVVCAGAKSLLDLPRTGKSTKAFE